MRDTIRKKIKSFFAFLIILFLLPYIISVFINGKNAAQGADSDMHLCISQECSQEKQMVDMK